MKKVLVVALSALLILALFIPAMADSNPTLTTTVDKATVKRGEEITVFLTLDKNVSTRNLAFDYELDTSVFAYSTGSFSNEIKMAVVNNIMNGTVALQKPDATSAMLAADPAIDISAGVIFTATFTVKDDAPFGTYQIKMAAGAQFPATCVAATVTVTHDCVPATTYSHDAEGHWYACTVPGCTVPVTKLPHDWTGDCDDTCDTCGETRVVTHDYSVQNKDNTNHWMECSRCHKVDESTKAAHVEGADIPVSPADCKNPAVYKKECTECGFLIRTFSVGTPDASLHSGGTATCTEKAVCQHCSQPYGTVDANNHVGTKKVEKDGAEHWTVCQSCSAEIAGTRATHSGGTATCKEKAVCTVCSEAYGLVDPANHTGSTRIEKNATEHWTVCDSCGEEVADSRAAHSGGTATCKDKAVCTVCSEAYGTVNAANHTGATKIEKNETEHWTVCQSCSSEIADTRAAHTGGTATCVAKKVCTECSEAYGNVDPANHTGNNDVIPAEPSTCTTLGKKEGVKCHDCGEILSQEPETELAPHFIDTWTEVKPASETEEGEKKGKCSVCEQEFTVKTEKLAATVKPENIVAPEGSKVELGETKLPEDTKVEIAPVKPEELEFIEENFKEEIEKIPEAAGKDVLAATSVMFESNITYTDPATGETIVDSEGVAKLPGKVKVTAPISADLANFENLVVLAVDTNGNVAKINATVENGAVVFETDAVVGGIMVLGAAKQAPAPAPETTTPAGDGAQTGDASQVVLFITLAIVSALSLGGIYVSKKARASK